MENRIIANDRKFVLLQRKKRYDIMDRATFGNRRERGQLYDFVGSEMEHPVVERLLFLITIRNYKVHLKTSCKMHLRIALLPI